jgi:PAS domain S-box-containing protein
MRDPQPDTEDLIEPLFFKFLSTENNKDFESIASMAADICGAKISTINLISNDESKLLSSYGFKNRNIKIGDNLLNLKNRNYTEPLFFDSSIREIPILSDILVEVEPSILFFASIPIVPSKGQIYGLLCLMHDEPLHFDSVQMRCLQKLSHQIAILLLKSKKHFFLNTKIKELENKNLLLEETQKINGIGTWEYNIELEIINWSETVYEIHEVQPMRKIERDFAINFYHPDYRPILIKALDACFKRNKCFNLECIIITAKGNKKWVRSTGRKEGNVLIGTFQDITEIKNNELKYKGIFNSTFSLIGFINTEGILLEANDASINIANIKKQDVIGKYFWDCYWWQVSKTTQEELKLNFNKVLGGKTVEYEVEILIANQQKISILFSLKPIFDSNNKVVFIIPEGRPIMEIVETRSKYKSVIEGTNVGTWELNLLTEETVYNERWAEIIGYTLKELQPTNLDTWKRLVHPDDLKKAEKSISQFKRNEKDFYEVEVRLKHKMGHWVWILDRGAIYERSVDGKPLKMYGTHQDITARKNEELIREELINRFDRISQNVPGMIYQFQLNPDGTTSFPYSSEGIYEIFGVSPEEVSQDASHLLDKIHPEDLPKFRESVNISAERNTQWNVVFRIISSNNEIIWAEGHSTPQKQEDGSIIWHGFIQNITRRKKAEDELIYSQNLLEALYNLSPLGIALNDYETGQFLDVNIRTIDNSGYTREELLSKTIWDITPNGKVELLKLALENIDNSGIYPFFETEYISKDKKVFPIALHGVTVTDTNGRKLIWSFIRDISDELEAERKLKEAISNLQAILNASQQVAIVATDINGKIAMFNSGAEHLLGYKAEEVVGVQTSEIFNLPDVTKINSQELSIKYKKRFKGYEHFVFNSEYPLPNTFEYKLIKKDGSIVLALLSVNTIEVDNEIVGILGVATDIGELKSREKEIKHLLNITNEQNERLRNFAYIISHNLRSHTGAMSGILELIQTEYPEIAQNELVSLVYKSTINLQNTMKDLTDVIKVNLSYQEKSEILLYNMIQKNIESLKMEIVEAGLNVNNQIKKDLVILGVPAYIDSIILNMITNALKYRSEKRDSYLRIFTSSDDKMITVYFEDNGLGMDLDEYGDKLFDLYKTFHSNDDSRGVGLFITKNQILSMGGRIDVKSKLNIGTTFIVSLPK